MSISLEHIIYLTVGIISIVAVIFIVRHRSNKNRQQPIVEEQENKALDVFTNTVESISVNVPAADSYWDNKIIDDLPVLAKILDKAVSDLLPTLTTDQQTYLENDWKELKNFIENRLHKDMVAASATFAANNSMTLNLKKQFHNGIQKLLKYST